LKDSLVTLGDQADSEAPLNVLESLTQTPDLNSDETITNSREVLDDIVSLNNDTHPMSSESAESVANIVDSLIGYVGKTDCNATGDITESLREKTLTYLDQLT